jgi:hypothetical protein
MKKIFFLLFALVIMVSFNQCKKEERTPMYTITGKLLESVGNPIPVSGFLLTLYRKENSVFLMGWAPGIVRDFKTNSDGSFSVTYSVEKGTGIYKLSPYDGPLKIAGSDPVSYPGIVIQLYPIPANKDTSLNIVYAR